MLNGFINLNKSGDMSSNKALCILKNQLKQNNILTKVGHFGTLDPIATGVLPTALGRAARLFDYSLDKIKEYEATFLFGKETDTLDCTGEVLSCNNKEIFFKDVADVSNMFLGDIMQTPPQYSAKVVNGVRAYKLARQGISSELSPKKITIYSANILEQIDRNVFKILIRCSGGTYIRSLVRDYAKKMNTVGIMTSLRRTQSGIFHINDSVTLDEIVSNGVEKYIEPMEKFTNIFDRLVLNDEQYTKLHNGIFPNIDYIDSNVYYAVYYEDKILGIGEITENSTLRIKSWLL